MKHDTGVGQLAHDKPSSTLTVMLNMGSWELPVRAVCCPSCQAMGESGIYRRVGGLRYRPKPVFDAAKKRNKKARKVKRHG